MPQKRLYTTKEAAIELGYNDDSYIRRLIYQKKLKAIRLNDRQYVITQKDIDNFIIQKKLDKIEKDIKRNPDL